MTLAAAAAAGLGEVHMAAVGPVRCLVEDPRLKINRNNILNREIRQGFEPEKERG